MTNSEPIVKELPKNPHKTQQKKLFLFTATGIFILITGTIFFLRPKAESYKLNDFTFCEVKNRTFFENISASGQIMAENIAEITAPFKAQVANIFVKPGDFIQKGTLLLKLKSEELDKRLTDADDNKTLLYKDLEKAKLELSIETDKYKKMLLELEKSQAELLALWEEKKVLYELGELSSKALEDAEHALQVASLDGNIKKLTAKKALLHAETALYEADKQYLFALKDLENILELEKQKTLFSKEEGIVLDVFFTDDQQVANSSILLKIATVKNPNVYIMIPISESEQIQPGLPAIIKTKTKDYPGVVDRISFDIKQHQQLGSFIEGMVNFIQDPEFIVPGTECRVEIQIAKREDTLSLPRGPYISTGQSMFVYKIVGSQAVKTDVLFGSFDGNYVEIVQGLSLGDRVITSSYDSFSNFTEIDIYKEGGREI